MQIRLLNTNTDVDKDVSEPLQVPSCKVTDLVDLVASGAGSLSQMNGEQQHAGNDGALHAVVVLVLAVRSRASKWND